MGWKPVLLAGTSFRFWLIFTVWSIPLNDKALPVISSSFSATTFYIRHCNRQYSWYFKLWPAGDHYYQSLILFLFYLRKVSPILNLYHNWPIFLITICSSHNIILIWFGTWCWPSDQERLVLSNVICNSGITTLFQYDGRFYNFNKISILIRIPVNCTKCIISFWSFLNFLLKKTFERSH
jgi:hypothetical protein